MLSLRHSSGKASPVETLARHAKNVPHWRCYASPPPTDTCARRHLMALDTLRSILGQRCARYFAVTTGLFLLVLLPSVQGQECPPDELSTLRTIVPIYIQWHFARHAEWLQDEVVDPILEVISKEEEGQEGTAQGHGPTFRLLLAILQAA